MSIRINRLRLSGATSTSPTYEVSFTREGSETGFRPLSIIAGPSLTGKTTVIDFIAYCLGGKHLPLHEEVQTRIRGAVLETELRGEATVIERSAVGRPSSFATLWQSALSEIQAAPERRLTIEPTSDPDSLSQHVLAAAGLDGVRLLDSAVKNDTGSAMLSIRDLFRVMIVTNDRLDSKNVVYERDDFMVTQKYQQTIEVMFGVYDNEDAVIAEQLHRVIRQRNAARVRVELLTINAERDYPDGLSVLRHTVDRHAVDVVDFAARLRVLDREQRSTKSASAQLRQSLNSAQRDATATRVRVRDRESLLDRLEALRGQYIDDRRKLDFLVDAEALFDPLRVTTCPACFHPVTPEIVDSTCSLCHNEIQSAPADADSDSDADPSQVIRTELRAVRSRINSITEYIARLQVDREILLRNADAAADRAREVASAVDAITDRPAPWLALRDQITTAITDTKLAQQAAATGVRAWEWVEREQMALDALNGEVERLTGKRRKVRPDRDTILRLLSARFAAILADIGYPKLDNAYIGKNFIPHVRGLPYTHASSGGMVVIALAWNLALWEVAHEEDADAPGLLIIDSPQKNLGHNAGTDNDFADAALVEKFYQHVIRWLDGNGDGAQLIIVDNSPPDAVAEHVVKRFTRQADVYPYGLIWDATT